MQGDHEDRFVVFVRADRDPERPEASEKTFISCPTYADAQRIRRNLHLINRNCVIRYDGETGGGD